VANTLTAAAPIALVDHAGDGTRDRAGTANERKRRPSAFRNPVSAGKQRAPSRPPQPLARRDPRIEVVAAGHTGFLTARVRPGCAQIVPWDRAHEMVPEPVPRPPPWVRTGNSASASALPSASTRRPTRRCSHLSAKRSVFVSARCGEVGAAAERLVADREQVACDRWLPSQPSSRTLFSREASDWGAIAVTPRTAHGRRAAARNRALRCW
jgi:hypothetical protein